jgi:uncharacterized protein YjbI with pentapeptide repeats
LTSPLHLPADAEQLRRRYEEGQRDFSHVQLNGAVLAGIDLTEICLDNASLGKANLEETSLIEASLKSARLTRANLCGAKLWAACLDQANLRGADLSNASLVSASLRSADLRDAVLIEANLSGVNAIRSNLIGAHLVAADAGGANFMGANFAGALLMEADFANAKLWQANLCDADLRNARFPGASLIGARLDRADLSGADLHGADLSETSLRRTNIRFPADDLANAVGCKIDFDTYQRSGWDTAALAPWFDAGAVLVDRHRFPRDVIELFESQGEGLTLFLRSSLEPFDRFIIDALIFSVLGPGTLCRAVEVLPLDNRGFFRLLGPDSNELRRVGQAISARFWTHDDPPFLPGLFRLPDMDGEMELFGQRLERVELRSIREDASSIGEADTQPPIDDEFDDSVYRPLTTVKTWRF